MKAALKRLITGESGQDLIEYALLAALIASVSVLALNSLGGAIRIYWENIVDSVSAVL